MRTACLALVALLLVGSSARAQKLSERVFAGGDGDVEILFASRPDVCGDGRRFIHGPFGGDEWIGNGDDVRIGSWDVPRRCERGPVRVRLTILSGQVTQVHAAVGPILPAQPGVRRLDGVPVAEAVQLLADIARADNGRTARNALLPILLADSTTPWPLLFEMARSSERSKSLRRQAAFWLARGAVAKLGLDTEDDDDDDVRRSAVFAISQQPRATSVPALLEIAHSDRMRPAVRAQALFWLGQSDDPRGLDYFATILK